MQHLFQEFNSKPDSYLKNNRTYSFQINSNISQKLSSDNILNQNIKIDNYILNKKLGQGTFGIVVLAIHEITGEKVAIKILEKEKIFKKGEKLRFERKIQIMKKMYHKNIVRLYNVIENFKEIFLVMEYIPGQELFDYITNKKRLDELESCKFYQQIISGIEYLSKTRVAHRDLKPENLLLDSKKNIKIIDFGLSNTYYENELLSTACGSPCYAAPEILKGEKYKGVEVDIWSSGIILYAMLCGYLPFEDKDNENLFKKIIKGDFNTPKYLSNYAVDLLHMILNVDPSNRFNIKQIKKHPWFNMINAKINISEGLLIDKYIIPFDEEIIKEMVEKYYFNEQIVKINIIINKHNHITTTYYLMLRKKIRNGKESIGDMNSKLFLDYIKDSNNLLAKYHYDFNKIIVERIFNKDLNNFPNENSQNQNIELNIFETNNRRKPDIKLNDNIISNFVKKSNYNKKESKKIETKYIKINNNKKLQTIESEKNNSDDKKIYLKKIDKNSTDKRNYISFREEKNSVKKGKKYNFYIGPNNVLSQKYFNSTFSQNNKKNLINSNADISSDSISQQKLENRIYCLKESILKNINHNIINNIQKTNNNISVNSKEKEYSLRSFFSSPKYLETNSKNKDKYKILKTENKSLLNSKNKLEYKNFDDIRTKKRSNYNIIFSEQNRNKKNISKFNYTKNYFHIKSYSRISRTPHNILRNLNNKLVLEQNIKNDLNRKICDIKKEKNVNNYVMNNNNNINININFTNIISKNKIKDESLLLKKNKERLFTNYKEINDLFRLNKFMDNTINNKKFFFNTSVSIEKGKKQTESENKYNRYLLIHSGNNKNLYDKYNRYNNPKVNLPKKKYKDNQYLKIKTENKMFEKPKLKKINNCIKKNRININNSLSIGELNKDLGPIEKRNTNIYLNNKVDIKNNNKEGRLYKTKNDFNYIKISNSKKIISDNNYKNKRHVFKHLNTDINNFNQTNKNLSLTNFNYFSNQKNNLINSKEIKKPNLKINNKKKNQILSEDIKHNKTNNFLSPFDLNSVVIISEGNINKKICSFLDNKKIKYKRNTNKYLCTKNELEFDINIINYNYANINRIFIIKSFHKMFKSVKSKNLYYKYISKLINNIK